MSWNGVPNDRPPVPSKDNASKGGKVSFKGSDDAGKRLGNKGNSSVRGTATKSDFKPLSFIPGSVSKIDHNKPSTYGPAPTGDVGGRKK